MGISRINDLLTEAKLSLDIKDYERVFLLAKEISYLKQKAFDSYKKLNETKALIGCIGLETNFTSPLKILDAAKYEFGQENYEDAAIYAARAYDEIIKTYKNEILSISDKLEAIKADLAYEKINIKKIDDTVNIAKTSIGSLDSKRLLLLNKEVKNLNKSAGILIKAKKDIKELGENNLSFSRINDSLKEAKLALELSEHKKVEALGEEISLLKEKAIRINKDISEIKIRIDGAEKSLNVSECMELLEQAISKFEASDFQNAALLIGKANQNIEQIISDSLLFGIVSKKELKFNIIKFTKEYWWLILIILVSGAVIVKISFHIVSREMLKRKIRNLEKEEDILKELMKKTQTDYFIKKNLTEHAYEQRLDKHEERLIEIKEKIPVLKEKLRHKDNKN